MASDSFLIYEEVFKTVGFFSLLGSWRGGNWNPIEKCSKKKNKRLLKIVAKSKDLKCSGSKRSFAFQPNYVFLTGEKGFLQVLG